MLFTRFAVSLLIPLALIPLCSGQFPLAGYGLTSDVRQHTKLDLDVRDIGNALDTFNFVSADKIYSNGKNSLKSSGRRTLRGFSIDASAKLKGEGYFELYRKYWNRANYADVFVKSALKGRGDFAGKPTIFRAEAAVKGAQYQNVWMYVIHEMEDAINDCVKKNLADNDKGVTAWDEAWAFYAGSAVGPTGKGTGFMLYTLAQKRCMNFKTCGEGSVAKANSNVLNLFNTGKQQLFKGQCSGVIKTKNAIVKQMAVPLVQGVFRYIDLTSNAKTAEKAKAHGEGWAFTAAVLPLVAHCNKFSAERLRDNFKPKANPPMKDGIMAVAKALQGVLGCMGISCSDVGKLPALPNCTTNGKFKGIPGTNEASRGKK